MRNKIFWITLFKNYKYDFILKLNTKCCCTKFLKSDNSILEIHKIREINVFLKFENIQLDENYNMKYS